MESFWKKPHLQLSEVKVMVPKKKLSTVYGVMGDRLQEKYRFTWKGEYLNLDGPKPEDVPQELWDTLKAVFEKIYLDDEPEN